MELLLLASVVLKFSAAVMAGQEHLPTFEVASVKPSDLNRPTVKLQIGHGSLTVGDRAIGLITLAFDLDGQLVEGGPAWIETDWWDIAAKGDTSAGLDQIKLMLQSLLVERFHLKFHNVSKTVAGFALTVDPKKGMLAKKLAENTPGMRSRGSPEGAPRIAPIIVGRNGITTHGASMKLVCSFLSRVVLRRPVIDHTGLDGIFNFELIYDDPDVGASTATSQYGDVFSALLRIGLRLKPATVPIDAFHIDNVERPSEN